MPTHFLFFGLFQSFLRRNFRADLIESETVVYICIRTRTLRWQKSRFTTRYPQIRHPDPARLGFCQLREIAAGTSTPPPEYS